MAELIAAPSWGYGTVFKATANGLLTAIHSFSYEDGAYPSSTLVQGADGNFYGTAQNGGTNGGWGTIFKITPAGILTPLFSFANTNGAVPCAGLVQDSDGNFYGTTDCRRRLRRGDCFQAGCRWHIHFPLLLHGRQRRQQLLRRAAPGQRRQLVRHHRKAEAFMASALCSESLQMARWRRWSILTDTRAPIPSAR